MKMSDVFNLPLNSDFDTVSDRDGSDLATFDTCKEDEAAAHAINNHDKLVEALNDLLNDCINFCDNSNSQWALEQAKAMLNFQPTKGEKQPPNRSTP